MKSLLILTNWLDTIEGSGGYSANVKTGRHLLRERRRRARDQSELFGFTVENRRWRITCVRITRGLNDGTRGRWLDDFRPHVFIAGDLGWITGGLRRHALLNAVELTFRHLFNKLKRLKDKVTPFFAIQSQ